MGNHIPKHVKITSDRRSDKVRVELDYGREAVIKVVWTADEALAIAGALAEAAGEILRTSGPPATA
jgi:hypothetical protein